jgi:hypothetical protein
VTRDEAIDLIAKTAATVSNGMLHPPADKLALQSMLWVPRNRATHGHDYAAGFIVGIGRMSAHTDTRQEVRVALFMMEEIMRYDGKVPEKQIRDGCDKLLAIVPAPVPA